MKIKPSSKNIFLFALIFQLYPATLTYLTFLVEPHSRPIGVAGIFALAELLLAYYITTWKRKAQTEVFDERELQIRLKVRSQLLNIAIVGIVVSTFLATAAHDPHTILTLGVTVFSILAADLIGHQHYRK